MKHFFAHLKFLLLVQLTGVLFFTLFRLGLFFLEIHQVESISEPFTVMLQSFWMGFRFDTVIACYIIALPCIVLLFTSAMGFYRKVLVKVMAWYIVILYSVCFLVCVADIPYFIQFFKHINPSIFNWTDEEGFVTKMIFKEFNYLLYLFILIAVIVLFSFLIFRYVKWTYKDVSAWKSERGILQIASHVMVSFLCVLCCFIGIRGRLAAKSPIRVGTACFSEHPIANHLGLNPVFYLISTAVSDGKYRNVQLMNDAKAVKLAQQYLGVEDVNPDYPIAREITVADTIQPIRQNVVIILMESVSAANLQRHGAENPKLRFLDSLSNHCYYFENCYSAGIHTMNGIYGTLFSFPAIFCQHPLKINDIPVYEGFSYVLKSKGYQTIYFTTHDDQFDNVGGFLNVNHIEKIISEEDYPDEEVLSNLGVPDGYMFEYSIPILNDLAKTGKPFFATFLTASNHSPIIIPDDYTPSPGTDKEQVMEYADWSLRMFFDMAKRQDWYDNTLFVLLGDHGEVVGSQLYDIPLSYNHIPLLIVSSSINEVKVFDQPTGQIDVFPTIMGLLRESYINNTLGVDAINNPRPYIYFSADDVIGCIDKDWLYVYHTDGREGLYNYSALSVHNAITENPERVESMKSYVFSMLQASLFVVKNNKLKILEYNRKS